MFWDHRCINTCAKVLFYNSIIVNLKKQRRKTKLNSNEKWSQPHLCRWLLQYASGYVLCFLTASLPWSSGDPIFLGRAAWGLVVLPLVLGLRLRRAMFSIRTGKAVAHEVSAWWRNVISETVKQNASMDLPNVKIQLLFGMRRFCYVHIGVIGWLWGGERGHASF